MVDLEGGRESWGNSELGPDVDDEIDIDAEDASDDERKEWSNEDRSDGED